MKKFIVLCGVAACVAACTPRQEGYTLTGTIGGQTEGMEVKLVDVSDWYNPTTLDSTTIHDGTFTFAGRLDHPVQVRLIIDATPAGEESDESNWRVGMMYIENSDMTVSGHIDSLTTYFYSRNPALRPPVLKGSAMEELSKSYDQSVKSIRDHARKLDDEYIELYFRNEDHSPAAMDRAVGIVRQIESLNQQENKAKMDFINAHPESIVAYDMAINTIDGGMYVDLTVPQIDALTQTITDAWAAYPAQVERFRTSAEKAKRLAIGEKYPDIELTDRDGKKVMLSQYVTPGHYVMLEFWASWCGPCRGEIPHLREVNKQYGGKGFDIVSISIDESVEDWQKAMKEENMVWAQLCDQGGFEGPVASVYNVSGVPTCIMLDQQGRFYKTNMRGAYLDATLQDIFGE